jgi:hypothetical protein
MQQSPNFGRMIFPQRRHSATIAQASVGITRVLCAQHTGQVRVEITSLVAIRAFSI